MSELPPTTPPQEGATRRVFGWVLLLLGGLWCLLTGGCGFFVIALTLSESGQSAIGQISTFLVITIIASSPGILMLVVGLRLLRRPRPRKSVFD